MMSWWQVLRNSGAAADASLHKRGAQLGQGHGGITRAPSTAAGGTGAAPRCVSTPAAAAGAGPPAVAPPTAAAGCSRSAR